MTAENQNKLIIFTGIFLTGLIFLIDLFLPLGIAGGIPYVALVQLTLWLPKSRHTIYAGLASTVLIIAGFFFSTGDPQHITTDIVNRSIAIFGVWIGVIFIYRYERTIFKMGESEKFRTLFESSGEGLVIVDKNGIIRTANPAFNNIFGYERGELTGESIESLVPERLIDAFNNYRKQYFDNPQIQPIEESKAFDLYGKKKDGTEFLLDIGLSYFKSVDELLVIAFVLDVTERKKAEQALKESEEKYRDLFENANDLIQAIGPEGEILDVNNVWKNTLGYSEKEIQSKKIFDIIHPDYVKNYRNIFNLVMKGIPVEKVDIQFLSKDGKKILAEGNINSRFKNGTPISTRGIFRDVTEQRKAEQRLKESEAHFRLLSENAPIYIMTINKDGKITYLNRSFPRHSYSEIIGSSFFDFIAEDYRAICRQKFNQTIKTGKVMNVEFLGMLVDHERGWFDASFAVLQTDKEAELIEVIALDITGKKQAEEKLRASEEQYRSLIQSLIDITGVLEPTGTINYISPSVFNILGYFPDEIEGQNFFNYVHPEDLPNLKETFSRGIKNPASIQMASFRIKAKNGSWNFLDSRANFLHQNPDVKGVVISLRDMTEWQKASKALEESEKKYKEIIETSNDSIYKVDFRGNFIYVNPVTAKISGYSENELLTMKYTDLIRPDHKEEVIKFYYNQFKKRKESTYLEFPIITKGGSEVWIGQNVEIHFDEKNKKHVKDFTSVARDITQRVLTAKKLKQSERFSTKILKSSTNGVFIYDFTDNKHIYINPRYPRLTGYSIEKLNTMGKRKFFNLFHPDDQTAVKAHMKKIHESKRDQIFELKYRFLKADGKWVYFLSKDVVFQRDEKGNPTQYLGSFTDITRIKEAEQGIIENQKRTKSFLDALPVGVYITEPAGNLFYINKKFKKIIGQKVSRKTVPQKLFQAKTAYVEGTDNHYPDDKNPVLKALKGEKAEIDNMEILKNKHRVPLQVTGAPIYNPEGKILYSVSVFQDITKRKEAESKLRASEHELKKSQQIANLGTWQLDIKKNKLFCSDKVFEIFGLDPSKVKPTYQNFMNAIHPDDKKFVNKAFKLSTKTGEDFDITHRTLHSDGTIKYVRELGEIKLDNHRKPSIFMGVSYDITSIKKTEEDLKISQEFLNSIVSNIPLMIFVKDAKDLSFVKFNKAGEQLTGIPEEKMLGKTDYDFFPKKEADFFTRKDREVLAGKDIKDIPEELITTKKGIRILHTKKVPIRNTGEKPLFLLGISEDITEQTKERQALIESNLKLQSVLDTTVDAVILADSEGEIVYFNRAAEKMFGRNIKDVVGKPLTLLMPEKYRADHLAGLHRFLTTGETHVIGRTIELEGLRKNGEIFPMELSLATWKLDDNQYFTGIIRDITKRKETEKVALADKSTLALSMDAVILVNSDGNITYFNNPAEKMFDRNKKEVIGKPFTTLVSEKHKNAIDKRLNKFLQSGRTPLDGETKKAEGVKKKGETFHFEYSLATWKLGASHYFTGVIVIREIAESKKQAPKSKPKTKKILETAETN